MTLSATFETMAKLKCKSRIDEYVNKGYTLEIAEERVAEDNHCNKISESPIYIIDDYSFKLCPCNFNNSMFWFLYSLSSSFKNGVLPFSGGMVEQPAQIIEAIQLINNLRVNLNLELEQKARNNG